ncbi:MAG: biotin/lipoyl-binding protein [Vallitaleaceae bacterium]|nr:biotin/lipoyl-binding protein [Vallitaleaceae bacterium]
MKKNQIGRLVLLFAAVLTLVSGCSLFPVEEALLAPPLTVPEQISYQTVLPTVETVERAITGTAYLVPISVKNYFYEYSGGRFSEFHVKMGDRVKTGDLLAELMTESLQTQLDKKALYLDNLETSYTYQEQIYDLEYENLEKAYTELKAANASSTDLELKKLYMDRFLMDRDYQMTIKKNDLDYARIEYEELSKQLEESTLTSEFDGVVTYVENLKEGDYLDTFRTILTVADPSLLQFEYTGTQVNEIKLDMEVLVNYQEVDYPGKVVFVPSMAPSEMFEQLSTTVRFDVPGLPEEATIGHSAKFKIVLEKAEQALTVPRKALKDFNGKEIVYTLEKGLRVENYVEVGVKGAGLVEILQGIEADDVVIIE